jgi:DNA-binding protein YbaB
VKVKELQEELTNTEVEATSASGGVTVTISGAQVPISVTVTDELLAQGSDAVSDAVRPRSVLHPLIMPRPFACYTPLACCSP